MKKRDYAVQQIKKWIKSGKYPAGAKLPAILKLATILGMADQPVRMALKELAGERIVYSRNGVGTFVCGPDTEKRKVLILTNYAKTALIKAGADFPVWEVYNGISETLRQKEYLSELYLLCSSEASMAALKKKYREEKFRGVILLDDEAEKLTEDFARDIGYENIVSAVYTEPTRRFNSVRSEFSSAVKEILEKAYSLGHRNFAFLYGRNVAGTWSHMERYRIFNEFCQKKGIQMDPSLMIPTAGDTLDGYRATIDILEKSKKVSLIFAATDRRAKGVIEALKDKGITPGKEVSVIGFDNMPGIEEWNLATIDIERYKIGMKAVEMLDQAIATNKTRLLKKVEAHPVYDSSLGPVSNQNCSK